MALIGIGICGSVSSIVVGKTRTALLCILWTIACFASLFGQLQRQRFTGRKDSTAVQNNCPAKSQCLFAFGSLFQVVLAYRSVVRLLWLYSKSCVHDCRHHTLCAVHLTCTRTHTFPISFFQMEMLRHLFFSVF